jgi:shikimate kinase
MNVALIGMSGVGKSRIGKLLAEKIGYGFIDIDKVMEQECGKRVQEIINSLGETKFLQMEEKTILTLGKAHNMVISPGGSIVYSEKAMNHLKNISKIVFLNAPLEEIRRRTPDFSARGIVGLKGKMIEALFEERLPLYRKYADITIDLQQHSDERIIEVIIEKLAEKGT